MSEHIELGKDGEELACEMLVKKGYTILTRNWTLGKLECDIIAASGEFIVFVEVKTRSSTTFGSPELFVTIDKQRNLVRLADRFIRMHNVQKEARFDIVSVVMGTGKTELVHLEDAFNAVTVNMSGRR